MVLLDICDEEKLFEMTFQTASGTIIDASNSIVFNYLLQDHKAFVGTVLLNLVVACMLWFFVVFHFYLVSSGYSTNEWSKLAGIKHMLEKKVNFYTKWASLKRHEANF